MSSGEARRSAQPVGQIGGLRGRVELGQGDDQNAPNALPQPDLHSGACQPTLPGPAPAIVEASFRDMLIPIELLIVLIPKLL